MIHEMMVFHIEGLIKDGQSVPLPASLAKLGKVAG